MYPPLGNPSYTNGRYNGSSEFPGYPAFGGNRVVLVAIHGGMLPPIFHERSALQRTRVVVVPPEGSEFDLPELLPETHREYLPVMPSPLPAARLNLSGARPVRGEILRGHEGRLYEKVGREIRPLHKVVSGPNGQIFEIVPAAGREPVPGPTENFEEPHDQEPGDIYRPEPSPDFRPADAVAKPGAAEPKPVPYRRLFPDPGQRRVVRLGDFKTMLASQLAHPERLRDPHRLACYLQVYESKTAQRLEALAGMLLGDPARARELQPLTEPAAQLLGLTALPRSRPRVPGHFPRQAGLLLPFDRLFRLQLAQDPTAEDASPAGAQPAQNLQRQETSQPQAERQSGPTAPPGRKTTIPERFLNPWEFKMTREETLYDMNVAANFSGWFDSLRRRLKERVGGRREWKKWQALLYGKSADEQLWGIRPPRGALSHPAVRDWVAKTLEAAGYEPRGMLSEWEIFWRRKGV